MTIQTAERLIYHITYIDTLASIVPDKRLRSDHEIRKKLDGRWRSFDYDEIIKRGKANLDIFWLKDDSLEDSENLLEPVLLAQEIVDDLQTALESFASIAAELKETN